MTIVDTQPQVQATLAPAEVTTRGWPPCQGEWTYADYERLPNDQWRYEIIKGELRMSPAPRTRHQETSLNLASILHQFASSTPGKSFHSAG